MENKQFHHHRQYKKYVNMLNPYIYPSIMPKVAKYGYLYNWYAASNANFAPVGWHVPTQTEFDSLITYLGANSALKLSEVGTPYSIPFDTIVATNEYNFSIRQSGFREGSSGNFLRGGTAGGIYAILTTTSLSAWQIAAKEVLYNSASIEATFRGYGSFMADGLSVRLLRSATVSELLLVDGEACIEYIDSNNSYPTIKIGSNVWLAANWACTKLNDGTPIPNVTDGTAWAALTTGAYCAYDNDITNVFIIPPN
jgi:uncharacterized protein (TIGR02145 family)